MLHTPPHNQVDVETVAGSIQAGKIPDMRGQGRAPGSKWALVCVCVCVYVTSEGSCVGQVNTRVLLLYTDELWGVMDFI
jgi:hypothetical protein